MDSTYGNRSSEAEDSLPMIDVDVVIIGAGISGLSAAYYIQKKDAGIRLAVLEAKGLPRKFAFILVLRCKRFCVVGSTRTQNAMGVRAYSG